MTYAEMLDGLKFAIVAREGKAQDKQRISRLDNARSHYHQATEEIKKGIRAIEQFDATEENHGMVLIGFAGFQEEGEDVYLYQCPQCKTVAYSHTEPPKCDNCRR